MANIALQAALISKSDRLLVASRKAEIVLLGGSRLDGVLPENHQEPRVQPGKVGSR